MSLGNTFIFLEPQFLHSQIRNNKTQMMGFLNKEYRNSSVSGTYCILLLNQDTYLCICVCVCLSRGRNRNPLQQSCLENPMDRVARRAIVHRVSNSQTQLTEPTHMFSSVAQSCSTLCNPMNHSMPGLPVHHQLPEFTQTHVHRVGDAIQPSHPLLSPSPPAPNPSQHQRLFQ